MKLKENCNINKSNGFTLAEVLITLVIIGVIAAMTIPTLMKNTQNQELVTGLKKANSVLQQAMLNMSRNNDAAVGDYSFLNDIDFIDELAKVTNVVKKCSTIAECFGSDYNTKYKKLSGPSASSGLGTNTVGRAVITSDGFIYLYYYMPSSGNASTHGISAEDAENSLGYIAVDVNGEKGPNTWGRDLFLFDVLTTKGIIPSGSASTSSCTTSNTGYGCTAKVIRENAINY